MLILVTGGAGYIGSHTVKALCQAGHAPLVLDDFSTGRRAVVEEVLKVPFVQGGVGDGALVRAVLLGDHPACGGQRPEAVIHFAGRSIVGESWQRPAEYYGANVADALSLLQAVVEVGATTASGPVPFIFSSSCAVYGLPRTPTLTEEHPLEPINPYGRSKRMVEELIRDFALAYGLPSIILRYFNAAGADPDAEIGEVHDPETHLIPRVLDAMTGRSPYLQIFGDDFDTPDGTGIRDYTHVCDLADAHLLAVNRLLLRRAAPAVATAPVPFRTLIYNLGTGQGVSVQQVIEAAKAVTGCGLLAHVAPRRGGDPARLVACADRVRSELGWTPRRSDLATILADAWRWHQTQPRH